MSKHETISVLQASMIMITAAGILDHVIVIPMLLQSSGRDAWVSVLLAAILLLGWIPLVFFVMKRSGQQHLFIWLKHRLGQVVAWFIILIILFELFMMCTMTIRDVSSWTNITFLPMTPNLVLVSSLALVSFYVVNSGIRSIAIVNGILLPFVVLLGFFVAIFNFPHKDYSLLFPLFEQGYEPVWKGMVYAGSGFAGMLYFVYMQHRLRSKMRLLPLLITGIILVELTLSPLTGAIAIFGPHEAARLRFPAYEEWRMVTFGHFLEHADFLSIYQWLVGSFTRISIGMFLIPDLLNMPKSKKRTGLLIVLFALMVAASQIPISDKTFMNFLSTVYLPYTLFFVLILSALFAAVAWIHKKRKVES
ncbi:GerAB/ArcD/ProY family transporter [Paenibacillus mendelii]|uniref:Endospore germination permease n=1 Tax=Paenibacillus mendelii TaxID=206163 RepID=A0ABV6JET3_9BACL|nr:endospore germination permease [Paenibacillus mendelii]MCQ6557287.1 endospore germination permease [Paenibacillus mendelii]